MDGNYWYLRFRHGRGTAERQPTNDVNMWVHKEPELYFEHPEQDGWIELWDFCQRIGLNLGLTT